MPDFKWDETEHPRGVLGRFIKGLRGAKTGESHNLQDNSAIVDVKNTGGRKSYRVRNNDRGYDESKTFRTAEEAAQEALDRSARKTGPDTLGPGSASYKDVSAAADEALRRSQKNLPTAEEIKANKRHGQRRQRETTRKPGSRGGAREITDADLTPDELKDVKTLRGHIEAERARIGLRATDAQKNKIAKLTERKNKIEHEAFLRKYPEKVGPPTPRTTIPGVGSTKREAQPKEAREREPGLADRQWASVSKAAQSTLAHLGEQDAAGRPLTQRKQKDGEPQFAALRRAGLIEGEGNNKKLTPLGRLAHRNAEAAKAKREAIDADRKKVRRSKPDFTKKESKEDRDRKRAQDDAPTPVGLEKLTNEQLQARSASSDLSPNQRKRAREELLRREKGVKDAGSGKLPSGVPLGEGPTTHTGWLGRYRKLDHDALITELATLRETDPDADHKKRRNALLSALAEAKGEKQIKKRPGAEKKKAALDDDERKGLSVGTRVWMEDRGRTVIGTVKKNDGGKVQVHWDGASSNWYSKDKQSLLQPVQSASEAKRSVGDRVYHVDFLGGSRDADHERLPYEILDMRTTPSGAVEYKVFDPETKGEFWGAQDLDLRTPDEFKHSHLAASAPERPIAAKLVAKLATAARIQAAHDIELRQAEASIAAYFPSRSAQMRKIQAEIRRRQVGAQAA